MSESVVFSNFIKQLNCLKRQCLLFDAQNINGNRLMQQSDSIINSTLFQRSNLKRVDPVLLLQYM